MTVPAVIGELEPVSLDELNDRAALTTRRDRKYLVPTDRLPALLEAVADHLRVLDIDGRRAFAYDTHYFDSPELTSYLDTARRRPFRYKIRTRHYVDDDLSWFEVKQRGRRGITVKHRWSVDDGPHRFGARELDIVAETLGPDVAARRLDPTLATRFERTTLLVGDDARMTVDLDVAFATPGAGDQRRLRHAIVETKTLGRPCRADRALWRLGVRPTKVSKYGTGLASLRPELPSNRWARLLRSDAWAA
ncbi:MAG: polyphosphate polymerase domain-containing protein [Acidimicrobiales bacterium]|nr:polyphosphate polymerase domain-containing protein [Acidimicrobiales bacterium]